VKHPGLLGLRKSPTFNARFLGHFAGGMIRTANFGFLAAHDSNLVTLGGQAERYFRDDPPTCLIKLRQLAELLTKLMAAHHAVYRGERETFEETLRRLPMNGFLDACRNVLQRVRPPAID
jgi:hypothetical protein